MVAMDQNETDQKIVVGSEQGQTEHAASQYIPPKQDRPKQNQWRSWGIMLASLTLLPIAMYIVFVAWLSSLARGGTSGTEFIYLVFFPFFLIVPALLVIDVIFAIAYLIFGRTSSLGIYLAILSLIVSLPLVGWLGYNLSGKAQQDKYNSLTFTREEAITKINNCEVDSISEGYGSIPPSLQLKKGTSEKQYIKHEDLAAIDEAAKNAPVQCGFILTSKWDDELKVKAISPAELTELLMACKVKTVVVYYTDNMQPGSEYNDALASTGIAARMYGNNKVERVEVRKDLRESMLAVARESQTTCPHLEIYRKEKDI